MFTLLKVDYHISGFNMRESELFSFYKKELKENILSFWMKRCLDEEYGGYLNCFDNRGEKLVSYDKYTWSEGRFLWLFSHLALTSADIFTPEERETFTRYAESGAEFLSSHALIKGTKNCVFLMERNGEAKEVSPGAPLDMSIYADCFVVIGMASYSLLKKDRSSFNFALSLYNSINDRVSSGSFRTLPYPLSPSFRAHGIPMILSNTARELYSASLLFDIDEAEKLKKDALVFSHDILDHFVDEDDVLHEIITKDNEFFPLLLGQHQNPGHTIEDGWFHLDAAEINGEEKNRDKIFRIVKKALSNGWDEEYGGLLHFCSVKGGKPDGDNTSLESEPMSLQLSGWGDKLWWVHSEALYTTLRMYYESGDEEFLSWYEKVKDYVYSTFPNPDKTIGEWIQIRRRDGREEDKVVALPVKDPFHIARNYLLILELLQKRMDSKL